MRAVAVHVEIARPARRAGPAIEGVRLSERKMSAPGGAPNIERQVQTNLRRFDHADDLGHELLIVGVGAWIALSENIKKGNQRRIAVGLAPVLGIRGQGRVAVPAVPHVSGHSNEQRRGLRADDLPAGRVGLNRSIRSTARCRGEPTAAAGGENQISWARAGSAGSKPMIKEPSAAR